MDFSRWHVILAACAALTVGILVGSYIWNSGAEQATIIALQNTHTQQITTLQSQEQSLQNLINSVDSNLASINQNLKDLKHQ